MYRMLGADPYPIHMIFPSMPFSLSIHFAAFFGGLFIFRLFPNQTNKWVARFFYVATHKYVNGSYWPSIILYIRTQILSIYLLLLPML